MRYFQRSDRVRFTIRFIEQAKVLLGYLPNKFSHAKAGTVFVGGSEEGPIAVLWDGSDEAMEVYGTNLEPNPIKVHTYSHLN